MVEMKQVQARKRDYGTDYGMVSRPVPCEYWAKMRTWMIGTDVTNIGLKRRCGIIDYRLQHLKHLEAASR